VGGEIKRKVGREGSVNRTLHNIQYYSATVMDQCDALNGYCVVDTASSTTYITGQYEYSKSRITLWLCMS
jgi:hypothetical protein